MYRYYGTVCTRARQHARVSFRFVSLLAIVVLSSVREIHFKSVIWLSPVVVPVHTFKRTRIARSRRAEFQPLSDNFEIVFHSIGIQTVRACY